MESHMSSTLYEENDSLHIAARSGQKEIMLQILRRHPSLIYHQNIEGDNPLHVAAGAGHLGVVKLLTGFVLRAAQSTEIHIRIDPLEIGAARYSVPIWRTENRDRSTALHEALQNKHEDVALYLLDLDSGLAELANAKDESPLYLAAKAGFVCVLNKILEAGGHPNTVGPNGHTPFHAAVFAKSQESIRILHESIPALINAQDSYGGKTALHYATEVDSLEIIRLLLELDPSSTSICDKKGLSPLSVALRKGRLESLKAILDACPTSKKWELINKPDWEGNTLLHLATMRQKHQHVLALLSSNLVQLEAKNNNQQTALEMCNSNSVLSDRQTMIRDALQYKPASNFIMGFIRGLDPVSKRKVGEAIPEEYMSRAINTMGVVAALIAAITFAAVFQVPGGYNPDGSPLLIEQSDFRSFVMYNSLAFCLSIVGVYYLVVAAATGADEISPVKAINASMYALGLALIATTYAFHSGINAVISVKDEGLAKSITDICWCVIGLFIVLGFLATTRKLR